MAVFILGLLFSGILLAYTQAARRVQWSGFSLAAQSLAIQPIERARSAPWDPFTTNGITNLVLLSKTGSNMTGNYTVRGHTVSQLDLPVIGTNVVIATNYVSISYLTLGSAQVPAQVIRVDTVWPFTWGGTRRFYTNSVATICAPDNCDRLIVGTNMP